MLFILSSCSLWCKFWNFTSFQVKNHHRCILLLSQWWVTKIFFCYRFRVYDVDTQFHNVDVKVQFYDARLAWNKQSLFKSLSLLIDDERSYYFLYLYLALWMDYLCRRLSWMSSNSLVRELVHSLRYNKNIWVYIHFLSLQGSSNSDSQIVLQWKEKNKNFLDEKPKL